VREFVGKPSPIDGIAADRPMSMLPCLPVNEKPFPSKPRAMRLPMFRRDREILQRIRPAGVPMKV